MTEPDAAPPSVGEINAEPNPTRKAVLAAMDRMLRGRPTITRPGLLSKAGLAREAQVDRNHITQGSCRDLGDRIAAIIKQRQEPTTAREAEQQAHIKSLTTQLDELRAAAGLLRQDRDKWQASTHTLLRAIRVLRLEGAAVQAEKKVLTKQLHAAREGENVSLYIVLPAT